MFGKLSAYLTMVLLTVVFATSVAFGQNATVSGTITGPSSQVYANGTYAFVFVPGPQGVNFGTGASTTPKSGSLTSGGAFSSVTLGRTDILGGGSRWQATICSAGGTCFTALTTITSATVSLSTVLSAAAPAITGGTPTVGTSGLLFPNGALIKTQSDIALNFLPSARPSGSQTYLFGLSDGGGSSSGLMSANGAAFKTYAFTIQVNRPSTAAVTGDSNDAIAKWTYNNYGANDSNFILRGLNSVVNNRSGGTLGQLIGGLASASSKSGSTSPVVRGLEVQTENFGTNATEHGGLDVAIKNEGAKATTQYGIRVRNIDQSNVGVPDAAILIPTNAGNTTGWNVGLDMNGATIVVTGGQIRFSNGAIISVGVQTTRNAVRSEVGTAGAIGSYYFSSAGKAYLKVATGGADTDWERVTTTAAD